MTRAINGHKEYTIDLTLLKARFENNWTEKGCFEGFAMDTGQETRASRGDNKLKNKIT